MDPNVKPQTCPAENAADGISETPNLNIFCWQHAPRLLQVWGVFGALTFILLRAPSKSHATLPTTCIVNSVDYEINAQGWKKTLGLEGDGGRGGGAF